MGGRSFSRRSPGAFCGVGCRAEFVLENVVAVWHDPPMNTAAMTWAEVCAIPWLKDIPAKIETNNQNKIIMSPETTWHGDFQGEVYHNLRRLMPEGRALIECPIDTTDGTRVPDVGWISRARWLPHRRSTSLPIAPEICVEILSPSNTREEMLGKMLLYYAAGAEEVWLCDEEGVLEFFAKGRSESVAVSALCPDFPQRLDVE